MQSMGCDSDSVNHRDKFRGEQGHCGLGQQKPVSHMKVFSGRRLRPAMLRGRHYPEGPGGLAQRPDTKDNPRMKSILMCIAGKGTESEQTRSFY